MGRDEGGKRRKNVGRVFRGKPGHAKGKKGVGE